MISRAGGSGAALLAAVVLTTGCVSALGDPPEVAELAVASGDANGSEGDAAALCAEASGLLDQRDAAAVERARRLFLEAAALEPSCLQCFLGASRAIAWLIEHEDGAGRREDLAVEGVHVAQLCERAFPAAPMCRYNLALAVGQQARERHSTATDGLDVMVEILEQLVVEVPELDSAGPNRVLALVLLRAPGWPTGPGDPEYGLDNAIAAVDLFPDHPPNQLVLGEALLENGRVAEGRRAFEIAVEQAERLDAAHHPEAGEWRAEGIEALENLH